MIQAYFKVRGAFLDKDRNYFYEDCYYLYTLHRLPDGRLIWAECDGWHYEQLVSGVPVIQAGDRQIISVEIGEREPLMIVEGKEYYTCPSLHGYLYEEGDLQ